jgi:hypothetical protein
MTALTPVLISQGVASTDTSMPLLPVTTFDQGIASLAANPAALSDAFWAGATVGSLPKDRVTGVIAGRIYTTDATGLPVINAADTAFPMVLPNGSTINSPSIDFSQTAKASVVGVAPYPTGGSWTFIMVFVPNSTAAAGVLFNQSGAPLGGGVDIQTDSLRLWTTYGNAANGRIQVPRSQLRETSANIVVACGDTASRQTALYVNSKTPVLGAPATGTWTTGVTPSNIFGNVGSGATPCPIRAARIATCGVSIHHQAASQTKLLALIQSASDTFGIALS